MDSSYPDRNDKRSSKFQNETCLHDCCCLLCAFKCDRRMIQTSEMLFIIFRLLFIILGLSLKSRQSSLLKFCPLTGTGCCLDLPKSRTLVGPSLFLPPKMVNSLCSSFYYCVISTSMSSWCCSPLSPLCASTDAVGSAADLFVPADSE